MEVLRHGKNFRILTCQECDCEFQFATTEMKTKTIATPDSEYYESVDYIECPECGYRTYIDKRVIEI